MTKPWEETWVATKANDLHGPDGRIIANFYEHGVEHSGSPAAYALDEARTILAAQAPAMARLLLDWARVRTVDDLDERTRSVLKAAGVLP